MKPTSPPNEPWRPPDITRHDPVLMDIYAKFGPSTLLVPFRGDQCLLSPTELHGLTAEKSHSISYQNQLCVNEVAVLCGRANANLCGIAVPGGDHLASLQEANSCLDDTLITHTPAGLIVWLRTKGCLPRSFRGRVLQWLADKDAATLRRALPESHGWEAIGAAVATVNVDKLRLPMDPVLAVHLMEATALSRWGSKFLADGKGGIPRLAPGFWASFAGRVLSVRYFPASRWFESFSSAIRDWHPISEERLTARLADFILRYTSHPGPPFHALGKDLRPVIEEMRVQFAVDELTQEAGVQQFVTTQMIAQPGSALTTDELNQAFLRFQSSQFLPPVSTSLFELLIGPLLKTRFGVCRSNSIQRVGGAKRGYRNIGLKPMPGTAGTAGTGG